MRTEQITRNIYRFEELSPSVKAKVLETFAETALFHQWWTDTYEDAETIGLKITSFDDHHLEAKTIFTAQFCAEQILGNHGKHCDTYRLAENFLKNLPILNEGDTDFTTEQEKEFETLRKEFLKALCEEYRIFLRIESEYLTSEVAIIESISANEYEFLENGEIA